MLTLIPLSFNPHFFKRVLINHSEIFCVYLWCECNIRSRMRADSPKQCVGTPQSLFPHEKTCRTRTTFQYIPMTRIASLTVVSGRSGDCDPSVLIASHSKSYLFNVPEQCARLLSELGISSRDVARCFCTSARSSLGLSTLALGTSTRPRSVVECVGPSVCAAVQLAHAAMRHCASFTATASASYSDALLTASLIPHGRTASFAVTLRVPDRVDAAKADALGVPREMTGEVLRSGFCVLRDGRTVDAAAVLEDPAPPLGILVVDVACLEELAGLPDPSRFAAVVHFTPVDLVRLPAYQARFPESAINVCFPYNGNGGLYSQFVRLSDYSRAGPGLFAGPTCEVDSTEGFGHFIALTSGDCIDWNTEGVAIRRSARAPLATAEQPRPPSSFRITFLGTGAGFVSHTRNAAGILVQTTGGFVLLDCGPGTYPQIRSHFGRARAAEILRNLTVWISHSHIDHVEGLVGLLLARSELTSENLTLCCCSAVREEIERVERLFGEGAFHITFHEREKELVVPAAIIRSVPVMHYCPGAMACLLTMTDGKRLGYSGDRLADGQMEAQIGSCDVLIHEGTYTSDLIQSAVAFGHTTFCDAIDSAAKLGAAWVFLTHISQRIKPHSFILPEANAVIAFDHMSVDFDHMAEAIPIAKAVLATQTEKETEKRSG
jgi:ribonuclease Z